MRRLVFAIVLISLLGESALLAQTSRRRSVRHPGGPAPAPLAVADNYAADAGATLTVPAPGVLGNDTLNAAALVSFGPSTGAEQTTLGSAQQTARGGSLTLSAAGGFTYTPASGFSGADTFKYVIRNSGGSSSAIVTIDVNAAQPAAVTDSYSTPPESSLFVPAPGVLTNDSLFGATIAGFGPQAGSEQTAIGASAATAQGGVITLNADGSFLYNPPPTVDDGYGYSRPFLGIDSFAYTIRGGAVSSVATVNVSVDVPTSGADFLVTTPGHFYAISGRNGENPVLELRRGHTYTFQISASPSHPFAILDAPAGSVINNNITQGTLTFVVPMTAQNYRYRCTTHLFGNTIVTVP